MEDYNNILLCQMVGSKLKTRDIILINSAKLFHQYGYHGTSLDKIAKACDIRKASLFYHFKSKQMIALSILEYLQSYCEKTIFLPACDEHTSLLKRLHQFSQATITFFVNYPDSQLPAAFAMEITQDCDPFQQSIAHFFTRWRVTLETLLASSFQQDLDNVVMATIAQLQGALVLGNVYRDNAIIEKICQQLKRSFRPTIANTLCQPNQPNKETLS